MIGGAVTALAPQWNWPYLKAMVRPAHAQQNMMSAARPSSRTGSVIVWSVASLGAVILVGALIGALALWVHYGAAVFFEMIAAGIAACF